MRIKVIPKDKILKVFEKFENPDSNRFYFDDQITKNKKLDLIREIKNEILFGGLLILIEDDDGNIKVEKGE